MEDNQSNDQETASTGNTPVAATPPAPMKKQGGSNKKGGLIFVLIIALLGVGIFFVVRGSNAPIDTPSPSPDLRGFETPDPTGTPEPIDREDYSIEVQNGTGIAKEASFLQGKLANLGYTDIEIANSEDQDNETTLVTFSDDVPDAIVDEIMEALEDAYKDVEKETDKSASVDIVIVTGLRKNQTPKPASTEKPEEDSSPELKTSSDSADTEN